LAAADVRSAVDSVTTFGAFGAVVAAVARLPGGETDADHARIEAAQRKLAGRDTRLAKYRAALDAGADPTIVAGCMSEVQGERLRAEREIGLAQPARQFTTQQIRDLVARPR
jgi:hypothetical protein